MKAKSNYGLLIITALFWGLFLSCSEEYPDPDYIPSLPQLWVDLPEQTHTITWTNLPLCPDPRPCKTEATFAGFDYYNNGLARGRCNLVGYYKNHHIEWSYPNNAQNAQCPLTGTSYIGVINSDKIGAYSPNLKKNLILERH